MSSFIDTLMFIFFAFFMTFIVVGYHQNKLKKQEELDKKTKDLEQDIR